ncbi:MAG: hypothetical protein WA676_04480 [Candidatus Sulfotelmatobacter sp.]
MKIRAQATEHIFYYMVGPNQKNMVSNFGRQMPITQVPRQAHQLDRIFVSDFDNVLHSGLNLQPSSIIQLQPVSFSHGNGFWKIKKNIVPLISNQAKAAAVTRVKVESERSCCVFRWPIPGRSMNRSAMSGITVNGSVMRSHSLIQYMKYR